MTVAGALWHRYRLVEMTIMLRSLRKVSGFWLRDAHGDLGKPKDWLFDSSQWTVRYLRVKTDTWTRHRSVLVAPVAFREIDELVSCVYLNITLKSLAEEPRLEDDRILPRLQVKGSCRQTGWIRDDVARTRGSRVVAIRPPDGVETAITAKPQLCSWREVLGFTIQSLDARIGRLCDLIAEDHNWTILFLVVDVGGWWGGKKLLVPPNWVEGVNCRDLEVRVNVGTNVVCDAPQFKSSCLFKHDYQEELLEIYYEKGAN